MNCPVVYLLSVYLRTEELQVLRHPHPAAAAVPVPAATGGTGQETGEDDLASTPAAGAATAAGCPAAKNTNMFEYAAQTNQALR